MNNWIPLGYVIGEQPTKEQVREARKAAGLSQEAAGLLVHRKNSTRWCEWESGTRQMQADTFELFLIKTGLLYPGKR